MSKATTEKMWRVFTIVLGAVVLPLAGWVWNTNIAVAQLDNDLGDAEETIQALEIRIQEADSNSDAIISIEKDIEYMKETLSRIERLVTV
jgi:hypothetical protein